MPLVPYEPFKHLNTIRREFDRVFADFRQTLEESTALAISGLMCMKPGMKSSPPAISRALKAKKMFILRLKTICFISAEPSTGQAK